MIWIARIFWIWFFIGFVLMVFFQVPDILQFSKSLFFVFFALYALAVIIQGWKLKPIQVVWIVIPVGFLSLWVEAVGTATGIPFGHYTYGDMIGWKVMDVPVTIGFAWIAVVTMVIMFSSAHSRFWRACEVGMWAMFLDLVLDPAAVAEGFWKWHAATIDPDHSIWYNLWSGAAFYTIPFSNFVSWFALAFVLSFFYPLKPSAAVTSLRAVRLYQAMLLMFAGLCIKGGFWWPVLLAAIFVLASEWRYRIDQSQSANVV